MEQINLWDVWKIFKKHVFKLFSLTIVGAGLAVLFMLYFITPQYVSRAQLLVNLHGSGQTAIQLREVQASVQLVNTYRDIMMGNSVLTKVNENLGGHYSVPELRGAIRVEQSQNSQAFNLTVTKESPTEAQNILTHTIDVFDERVREVYGANQTNIHVLSPASFESNPVSPSLRQYLVAGAVLGGLLGLAWILLIEITDTTVSDSEFVVNIGLKRLGHVYELSNKEVKQSSLPLPDKQKPRKGGILT